MPPPRRKLLATEAATLTPPDSVSETEQIARVVGAAGNNLYKVTLPSTEELLVEMPAKFRSTIWLRRGGYVLIDTRTESGRDNKIQGEIINVVRDEKTWRKAAFWPGEFAKPSTTASKGLDEEQSKVEMMPPSDEE